MDLHPYDTERHNIYRLLMGTTIHMPSRSWIHHIAIHHINFPM
jgi:hypothetical protein